ncbi:MAG: alpha/beta hydrolase [Bdellovibrionota bacterium]
MSPTLSTDLVLLAIHGSPGFTKDFDPLFRESKLNGMQLQAIPADSAHIETALRSSEADMTAIVGYSWGAYAVLKTLLQAPSLHPRIVVLIAPFLAPSEKLTPAAALLARAPLLSDLIVSLSWKKWRASLGERMFHEKDTDAAASYLKRLDNPAPWKDVLKRKLLQENEPLVRAQTPKTKVHIVFGEKDRITNIDATENLLRSLGIHFSASKIPGAEHGLLWTHTALLAAEIARIVADSSLAEKGSRL